MCGVVRALWLCVESPREPLAPWKTIGFQSKSDNMLNSSWSRLLHKALYRMMKNDRVSTDFGSMGHQGLFRMMQTSWISLSAKSDRGTYWSNSMPCCSVRVSLQGQGDSTESQVNIHRIDAYVGPTGHS